MDELIHICQHFVTKAIMTLYLCQRSNPDERDKRPISQIPQCNRPISHNESLGGFGDICLIHCGICQRALLHQITLWELMTTRQNKAESNWPEGKYICLQRIFPCFSFKTRYLIVSTKESHCWDKVFLRSSYHHNTSSYTDQTTLWAILQWCYGVANHL